jgi:protein TonB
MKIIFQLLWAMLVLVSKFYAQISPTDPEFEAIPIGIKDQLENTLSCQFTMPKALLNAEFNQKVIIYLNVDSTGHPYNFTCDKGINTSLRVELIKVLRLMQFKRTLRLQNEAAPYFISIPVSVRHYLKYRKQKEKAIVKSKLPIDTSMIIYTKADVSPTFYKNGDEGLADYFLNDLNYPKLANEQSIEGTVVVEFVVETNGYAGNIDVKKGVNGGCTEEAVRLIKNTRWQPAEKDGQLVRYKESYPVTFSLLNKGRTQAQSIGQ